MCGRMSNIAANAVGGKASRQRRRVVRFIEFSVLAAVFILAVSVIIVSELSREQQPRPISPVPKFIAAAVNFPIFYPEQKELPEGYYLNLNSFKQPVAEGVNYIVDYNNGKEIVFSLQPKPQGDELQDFEDDYIPLHNDYQTPNGQAMLGAYNTKNGAETLVSLPLNNSNTWIIITAPSNTNQTQLEKVLNSLKRN